MDADEPSGPISFAIRPPAEPRGTDVLVPNVARIYDYLLGGKDNFAADRQAADELIQLVPNAAEAARENRGFLQRAVTFLAGEAGIRQFIDIGTGLPTRGNVHQVAQARCPDSRVLYVDNDTVVVAHARALLADNKTVVAVNGDLRQPGAILDHPVLRELINLDEPVALLLVAILHFIGGEGNPHKIVAAIMAAMPPGSYLVLSHATADHLNASVTRQVRKVYGRTAAVAALRSRAEIERFFDGLDLIEPGLVNVSAWPSSEVSIHTGPVLFYAGIGMKR